MWGGSPSMATTDLPSGWCPVTTRRIGSLSVVFILASPKFSWRLGRRPELNGLRRHPLHLLDHALFIDRNSPLVHLVLANQLGAFHDEFAPFIAALHVPIQPLFDASVAAQLFRQYPRIFDRHARSLSEVRGGGMSRIADQHDAACVPWRMHQNYLHRLV